MTSALRHLTNLLEYARRRRAHDRFDRAVVDELTLGGPDPDLPAGLDLRWLGVAGFAISYQQTTVLIDPYVSRAPVSALLRRRTVLPRASTVERWVPRADAVLLGHTHFDHAVDAPAIARRDDATVYGGESSRRLMALHGQPERSVVVEPHQRYAIGPFTATFVPSRHSKLLLGRKVPNGGEITCEHVGDLSPQSYQCGQVWGIHLEVDTPGGPFTLYHQGSADLIEDELRHRDVDLFLCGVAGRQFTDDYTGRILRALQPDRIVIAHHDDFFVPLEEPQGFAFGVDVERFVGEVAAVSEQIGVVALPSPSAADPAGARPPWVDEARPAGGRGDGEP